VLGDCFPCIAAELSTEIDRLRAQNEAMREQGYAQAIAEVVTLLKTSRTVGGEVITSARHAADVIARGDARAAARIVQLEAAERDAGT
jgi:hypothetical protein